MAFSLHFFGKKPGAGAGFRVFALFVGLNMGAFIDGAPRFGRTSRGKTSDKKSQESEFYKRAKTIFHAI